MAQSTSSQYKGALLYSSGQSIGFQWVTQRKATEEEQELSKEFPCSSDVFLNYFIPKGAPDEFQKKRWVFGGTLYFHNTVSVARIFYFLAVADITRWKPHLCYKKPWLGNTLKWKEYS